MFSYCGRGFSVWGPEFSVSYKARSCIVNTKLFKPQHLRQYTLVFHEMLSVLSSVCSFETLWHFQATVCEQLPVPQCKSGT